MPAIRISDPRWRIPHAPTDVGSAGASHHPCKSFTRL